MCRVIAALSLAALSALLVGTADGQQPPPPFDEIFARFDANKDGKWSRAEFDKFAETAPRMKDNPAAADAIFKRLDTNNDGHITLAELKKIADFAKGQPGDKKGPLGKFKKDDDAPKEAPTSAPPSSAKPATPEQIAFFEKKIRPVLIDQCYSCHSAESKKVKGGLLLDTHEGLLKGGDTGPALVPGSSKQSLLIKALKGSDKTALMPPKEKLSADVIADFEKWIDMGAPDPRHGKITKKAETIDIAKGKEHWSFQQPKKAQIPETGSAAIDALVAKERTAHNLKPVAPADKTTLIRRVYFDLIGLPPSTTDIDAFLADKSDDAFEKVVDKLLASPAFGERWGRHWLDVVRYAESSGKEQNMLYPFAWRYRDYVIAAFNADKPYDQFLKEQLAGDLMPSKTPTEQAEHLIATGFYAIGPKSHNERNPTQFKLDLADEQIDAMSQGMLGLTVACARCHDHKFDPIPQADYYAIAGIFTSTETKFGTAAGIQSRQAAPLAELPANSELPQGPILSAREVEQQRTKLASLKKELDEVRAEDRKNMAQPVRALFLLQQIAVTEKQLSYYAADGTPKKMAMAVGDKLLPRDSPIYQRGEPEKPGNTVPRGFLQVLQSGKSQPITKGSGRKELSEWIASAKNPLTARVYVNRIWLHLFGQGVVPTPDNFGVTGRAPSNQTLLDYLAVSFTENGWSTKKMIRTLVLSKTYQLSSNYDAANAGVDPENVYLWRSSKRRLDAEAIRDAMYAISGQLDNNPAQGSAVQKYEGNIAILQRFGSLNDMTETRKRSVYIPIIRDHVPESLELFDFAEPSLVTGARDATSVPSQALYLMNNPNVIKLAEKTAERWMKEYLSETERINGAFRQAFGRPASTTETAAAQAFLKKFMDTELKGRRTKADVEKAAWATFAQSLFAAAEFRYVE